MSTVQPVQKESNPWLFLGSFIIILMNFIIAIVVAFGPAIAMGFVFRKIDKKLLEYGLKKDDQILMDGLSAICQLTLYVCGINLMYNLMHNKGVTEIGERLGKFSYWQSTTLIFALVFVPCFIGYVYKGIKIVKGLYERAKTEEEPKQEYRQHEEKREEPKQEKHSTIKTPWEVLGVSRNDSPSDVKKAYYKMMGQYHPDRLAPEFKDIAEMKCKEINSAYEECIKYAA